MLAEDTYALQTQNRFLRLFSGEGEKKDGNMPIFHSDMQNLKPLLIACVTQ